MKSEVTIGTKLMVGFGAMLALIVALGYTSLQSVQTLGAALSEAVNSEARKLQLTGHAVGAIGDMLSLERGMLLRRDETTHVERYKGEFTGVQSEMTQALKELQPLVETATEREALAAMIKGAADWNSLHQEFLAVLSHTDGAQRASAFVAEKLEPLENHIEGVANGLLAEQSSLMDAARKSANTSTSRSTWIAFVMIGLALVAATILLLLVRRINADLRRAALELGEGAEQVAAAAGQVSSSSQSLAQGASEQAASIEETSASSEEINSMARKNTENSHHAASLVSSSQQKFGEANQKLDHMVVAMGDINASSDKISKIIKTIDEIAFQTNILALNAAVEAARAGEAGMGFAVVADEVRNLAQRCAQAAKDTAALIEESIAKSNDGKVKVDQVAAVIRTITEEADRIKTLVDEVNLGSQEQARGIEQIAKAITQMEQVTQKNAANAEESASAAEELNAQSETLKDVVERLTAMVGGGGHTGGATYRRAGQAASKYAPHAGHSGLAALGRSVSGKPKGAGNQPHEPVLVAAKADRHALPLEGEFKEF